jgi:hypothetical protein
VGVEIVPNQDNRATELLVSGVQQGGVIGLGEVTPFSLAAAVDAEALVWWRP